ncbi:MAG: hypothetical protein FWJ70_14485 [Micromonosporaceae bacterium]
MGRGDGYYWCVRHDRVESGDDRCRAAYRLGPFETVAEAERALETVRERNQRWDEEDARWYGEAD